MAGGGGRGGFLKTARVINCNKDTKYTFLHSSCKKGQRFFSFKTYMTYFLLSSSLKMSAQRCLMAALVEPSIRK